MKKGFCIFIDALIDGPVPIEIDCDGSAVVYKSRSDAEREIVECIIERCQQFLDGQRHFDDATTIEEYVLEVERMPNGTIRDECDRVFGKHRERLREPT